MSSTVVGWLFGGWSFGRSRDESRVGRVRATRLDDRETGVDTVGEPTDDDRLVAQVRAGDATALKTLLVRYFVPLAEFAASYLGSIDEGEEVVADVFARVWEHRATWTATSGVSAYLFRAVRNRAFNAVKRRALHHELAMEVSALGETPGIAPPALGPMEQVERDDDTTIVGRLIAKLPERRRLILSLRWKHELTWDEIAAVLGATPTAVRMEHSRILASLRAQLQEG